MIEAICISARQYLLVACKAFAPRFQKTERELTVLNHLVFFVAKTASEIFGSG
jgi:hypothetical protein